MSKNGIWGWVKMEKKDELFWKRLKLILQLPLLIETSNHKINIIRTGKLTLLNILISTCIFDAHSLSKSASNWIKFCILITDRYLNGMQLYKIWFLNFCVFWRTHVWSRTLCAPPPFPPPSSSSISPSLSSSTYFCHVFYMTA